MKDFFISYNKADKQWAEWIAWQLEEAGYSLVIQEWDFRPGGNFVIEMQKAIVGTKKTIAVLSDSYLKSSFTQPEWGAAFADDPEGNSQKLLPVKVQDCKPTGLLKQTIHVSLFGVDETTAQGKLLDALKDRGKPDRPPFFPGDVPTDPVLSELREVKIKPPFPMVVMDEKDIKISQQPVKSYLIIKVEPNVSSRRKSKKCYFVKAWFVADERKYQSKNGIGAERLATSENNDFVDTEEVFTITEIKKLIPAFIYNSKRQGLSQNIHLTNLTIELFLPDELLNESIDRWSMDDGDSVFSLGSKYQIILRSVQRLQQKQFVLNSGFWQQKWHNMPEPGVRQSSDLLVAGDNMSYECLFQQLEPAHIMGLTFVENPLQVGKNSPIAALRSAGAPIAMWLREPLPNVDQTTIDSLLECCLHDLPSVVKQQRLAASSQAPGSHIGHHLALLWDSFDRLPPDLDFYMS